MQFTTTALNKSSRRHGLYLLSLLYIGLFTVFSNSVEAATPAVTAGGSHTCALTNGGAVQCWGENVFGQLGNGTTTNSTKPVAVTGLSSGVIALAAGYLHTCALTDTGAVLCWGSNSYGQLGIGSTPWSYVPTPVSGLSSGVIAITAGNSHTCALTNAGAMLCWGQNTYGQLGDSTTTNSTVPKPVSGLSSGVTAITAGRQHTCAITSAAAMECWGSNTYGQLGDGTTTQSTVPVPVSDLGLGIIALAAGVYHTCAVTNTGAAKCWGGNSNGQLGDGTTTPSTTPVPVSGLSSGMIGIGAGYNRTCARTSVGTVLCWGSNLFGQSGIGTTSDVEVTPAMVSGLSGAVAMALGEQHTCAVTIDGTAQCWGYNGAGQLGNGTSGNSATPEPVTGLSSGALNIAGGYEHTCAVTDAGAVQCWGNNVHGQLGNGTTTLSTTPVPVSGLSTGAVAATAGYWHSCALINTGEVKCWGDNRAGQLGNGTTTNSTTPVFVSNLSGVDAVAAGSSHTCALTSSGAMECWGYNGNGRLGNGTTTDSTTPVPVTGLSSGVTAIATGWTHTCAVTILGAVQCWGGNDHGQLGNGTTTQSTTPVPVSGLSSGIVAIATGSYFSCAVTDGGAVLCWGDNTFRQLGNGSSTDSSIPVPVNGLSSGVIAISAGIYHACALTNTGTVQCWGAQRTSTSNVAAISAGGSHTCAITDAGAAQCWGSNYKGQLGNGVLGYATVPGFVVDASGQGTLTLLDLDNDSVGDAVDNCTLAANSDQRDTDGDGYGNICDPDFDNSGVINASDLAYLKSHFFSTDPDADLDGSGFVNAADLAILKQMFFGPPGPSGLVP